MVQFKSCFPSELWDFSCSWKIIQHLRFTLTPPSGASNTPNLILNLYCVSSSLWPSEEMGTSRAIPRADYPGEGSLKQSTMCKWIQFSSLLWVQGCSCISFSPPDNNCDIYSTKYYGWSCSSSFSLLCLNSQFVSRHFSLYWMFSHIVKLKFLQCRTVSSKWWSWTELFGWHLNSEK